MNDRDLILSAKDMFQCLCKFLKIDWQQALDGNSFNGSFRDYEMRCAFFDMYKAIQENNAFPAWQKGMDLLQKVAHAGVPSGTDDPETWSEYARFVGDAAGFIARYRSVAKADRDEWWSRLRSMVLLTDEEKSREDITEVCPRSMVEDVQTVMDDSRMLHIYRYRGDGRLITQGDTLPQARFGYEHINALLLEDKGTQPYDWHDHIARFDRADMSRDCQTVVDDYIFPDHTKSAIVRMDNRQIAANITAWSGNLMPDDKFDRLQAWSLCNDEFTRRQRQLTTDWPEIRRQGTELGTLIQHNLPNVLTTLHTARHMLVFVYDPDADYSPESVLGFSPHIHTHIFGLFGDGWPLVEGVGGHVGCTCKQCGRQTLRKHHSTGIVIKHYAMLAWLAGVRRTELPFAYANYMAAPYRPYYGNPLLENVNPMFRLLDSLSREQPNRFFIELNICKRCRSALFKGAMDDGVLVINSRTCQAEGVYSIPRFVAWAEDRQLPIDKQWTDYFRKKMEGGADEG